MAYELKTTRIELTETEIAFLRAILAISKSSNPMRRTLQEKLKEAAVRCEKPV